MIHLGGLLSHQATFKSSEWGHLGPLPPYRFLFSKYWQIWSQTPSKQEITQVLVLKKKKAPYFLKGKFFCAQSGCLQSKCLLCSGHVVVMFMPCREHAQR